MGLLDSLASMAGGASGGGNGLLPVVLRQLANYPGGVAGLIAAFQKGGLGEVVQSWIGTGQNLPVSAQQLDAVLDRGTVDAIARESGQDRPAVLEALAGLLPKLVDQATPDGSVPAGGFDAGGLLGMLGGALRG
jgi:Uncharacterized protein conserved in bacteria